MCLVCKAACLSAPAPRLAAVAAAAAPALNAAVATFPAPIDLRWFADFAAMGVARVNDQSVGTGAGVRQFVLLRKARAAVARIGA